MTAEHRPHSVRSVVLIPTYNERENLPRIVDRLHAAVPDVDVLVLDDNSPDGTGHVADELALADGRITVVHRTGKQGLGRAYITGFAWARDHGYDFAVEMDADGSHQPEELPKLLSAAEEADLVIGSRWVNGGTVVNWPRYRKAISILGNTYTKFMLGMPVKDATGGYRVYRISALDAIDLESVDSVGYGFQVDMTWRAVRAGMRVVEVPIEFRERELGESKMSGAIVLEAMFSVTKWGVSRAFGAVHRARQPAAK
jgi:dolichol-phosphate mannosyltransferase